MLKEASRYPVGASHEAAAAARIFASIAPDLEETRREIDRQLESINSAALPRFESFTADAVHHLFRTRGKYLRPTLLLLTAHATGGAGDRSILARAAAAIELIHSASLVHDDVIDESDERRGRPSLNAEIGNKAAVLTGDLLFDQAFALLTEMTDLGHQRQIELFRIFTDTTRTMCLGEMYEDLVTAHPERVAFDDYLKVIDYKTASLMASCCAASAVVTNAPDAVRTLIEQYGRHLGLSYQLIDDVHDHDSIYYDRTLMLDMALDEAQEAAMSIGTLAPSRFRDRLMEFPEILVRRAKTSIAALAGD